MNVYGVMDGNEIIAIHKNRKVIKKYINDNKDLSIDNIVKIKNKKYIESLSDVYLVKYRNTWIQEKYISILEEFINDNIYYISNCLSILSSLKYLDISEKDLKAVNRVIKLITGNFKEVENIKNINYKMLKELKEVKEHE